MTTLTLMVKVKFWGTCAEVLIGKFVFQFVAYISHLWLVQYREYGCPGLPSASIPRPSLPCLVSIVNAEDEGVPGQLHSDMAGLGDSSVEQCQTRHIVWYLRDWNEDPWGRQDMAISRTFHEVTVCRCEEGERAEPSTSAGWISRCRKFVSQIREGKAAKDLFTPQGLETVLGPGK